jgi:hypothetical protein
MRAVRGDEVLRAWFDPAESADERHLLERYLLRSLS